MNVKRMFWKTHKAFSARHSPMMLVLVSSLLIYSCIGQPTTTTSARATTTTPGQVVFTQVPVTSSGGSPLDGSIVVTCAETLMPADSNMISSGINISDISQVMNWTYGTVCRNYHNYFSCLRTELNTRKNLSTFDTVLFGIMDLDGSESGYTDMCSNIDYIVENAVCMANIGQNTQLTTCIIMHDMPKIWLTPDNNTSLCSSFASYTNCLKKPLTELCDEDFASFIHNITLKSLVPECRRLVTGEITETSTNVPPQTSTNGTYLTQTSSTVVQSSTDGTSKGTRISWSILYIVMTSLVVLWL